MPSEMPSKEATRVSPRVTAVPSRNKPRYWESAPKSSWYPMAGLKVGWHRLEQPFLRNGVEAAILLHRRDQFVDLRPQFGLALIDREIARRIQQLEFLFRLDGGVLRKNVRPDVVADNHQLNLTRKEGGNHSIVVAKALDIRSLRRHGGQRGVLDRAAVDGDALALQIGRACGSDLLGTHHGNKIGRISGREVDNLLALGILAHADEQIDLVFGEVRNAILAGDAD